MLEDIEEENEKIYDLGDQRSPVEQEIVPMHFDEHLVHGGGPDGGVEISATRTLNQCQDDSASSSARRTNTIYEVNKDKLFGSSIYLQ